MNAGYKKEGIVAAYNSETDKHQSTSVKDEEKPAIRKTEQNDKP